MVPPDRNRTFLSQWVHCETGNFAIDRSADYWLGLGSKVCVTQVYMTKSSYLLIKFHVTIITHAISQKSNMTKPQCDRLNNEEGRQAWPYHTPDFPMFFSFPATIPNYECAVEGKSTPDLKVVQHQQQLRNPYSGRIWGGEQGGT